MGPKRGLKRNHRDVSRAKTKLCQDSYESWDLQAGNKKLD